MPDRWTHVTHVGRSSGSVRRRACDLPYPASGRRSRPPVAFPACVSTRASRCQRPGCCPLFHAPNPSATSTDCPVASDGGGGDSPARERRRIRPAIATSLPLRASAAEAQAADRSLIASVRLSAPAFLHRTA